MRAERLIEATRERLYGGFAITDSGCWEWQGRRSSQGYGYVWDGSERRHRLAHRASFQLHNDDWDPNLHVCHACDNPSCVNPQHLFQGSASDNMRDAQVKGRKPIAWSATHCNNGHEFTPSNTYLWRHIRHCRECSRAASRAYQQRRRKAAKEKS